MRPLRLLAAAVAAFVFVLPLFGQGDFTCDLNAPSEILPGQAVTFQFTSKNTSSKTYTTTGSPSDDFLMGFTLGPFDAGVYPHVTIARPVASDSQLSSCFAGRDDTSRTIYAICASPTGQAASIAAGAVETLTTTVTVDASSPNEFQIARFSSIQLSSNSLCDILDQFSIGASCSTTASAPPVSQSDAPYDVGWTSTSGSQYEIDESTAPDFSSSTSTQTVTSLSQTFQHTVGQPTTYYYRVRSTDCNGSPGPYSPAVRVVVQPVPTYGASGGNVTAPFGSTVPVEMKLEIPAPSGKSAVLGSTYSATTDKPYLTVSPSTGTLPATVTVTINPSALPPGASTGTVTVTSGSATVATPVSISLVTPVAPGGVSTPPANAILIPVVTHASNAVTTFQSDVRLANAATTPTVYTVSMVPTLSDATQTASSTKITVGPGQTIALNDIASTFFGYGATGSSSDQGFGSLQIRPGDAKALANFASSRTYANGANGTFGQFVAAVPLTALAQNNAGHPQVLSLQQLAESNAFHTNLGIVEGSGQAASGTIRILDDNGTVLKSVPFKLSAGEHQQINHFISANGIALLNDGRIELEVDSPGGAVTAYASVLDNITQDPYAVAPVQANSVSSTRFTLPGIADLNNGTANFHTNVRIFNAGSTSATVTPTYFPQGAPGSPVAAAPMTIGAGQVAAIDNALPAIFGTGNSGGSMLLTTAAPASLVVTADTFSNAPNGGTYGQFIPGVIPSQGIAAGDRALELLQLEESPAFRTNLGVVELTGNAVHVRVTLIPPDAKAAPSTEFDLAPNEFRQLPRIMASMNPGNTYNGRITVEVLSGSGRITAYASVIDNRTEDPTYVPAQ